MPRPKRNVLATIDSTITPPDTLPPSHVIARITKAEGKNLYNAELPDGTSILAELEAKFRSTVWIKRGSYVVIDTFALADRENKLDGEIVNVVRDEKAWRKMSYWYVGDVYMQGYHKRLWYNMLICHAAGPRNSPRSRHTSRTAMRRHQQLGSCLLWIRTRIEERPIPYARGHPQ